MNKEFVSIKNYIVWLCGLMEIEFNERLCSEYEQFVDGNEYKLFVLENYDDVLLRMSNNWYWCVERNEEVRFVEVDKNELEVIKSLI